MPMNQQQLDQIKARAQAALPNDSPPNMEKVRAMAEFRRHAANDVLELVAEVERLSTQESILTGIAAQLKAMLTEAQEEAERLRAEVEQLTPKPRRQLTPEEIRERIDDNFFDEEYD